MSQRIVTDCDMHAARDDELRPGAPYDLALRVDGKRFEFVTVDLCETCAKALVDVFAEVSDVGRPFDGDPVEAVAKRSKRAASASREVSAAGRPRLSTTCPQCDHESPNRSALRAHVKDMHDASIGELEGVDKLECPECHREFAGSAALGSHMRVHKS